MQKKFVIFLIVTTLSIQMFTGCFEEEKKQLNEILPPKSKIDYPAILPDWMDGEYHDYYDTMDLLQEFQINYPNLVNIFSIGKSVLGKEIWCIRITNENNTNAKYSCLIDGCIHGCEWEAGEACLYPVSYTHLTLPTN